MRVRLLVLIALLSLTACTAATPVPSPTAIPRLPTVTPEQLLQNTPTPRIIRLSEAPLPVFTPTPIPTPVVSAAGITTASMAQLGISAEPYATLGDPNAPVTIIEFTDFGCTFCRRHHLLTFPALQEEFISSGQVFYVVRQLPVTSPQGDQAALAALCAGEQGKYWEMHDQLFTAGDAWYSDASTARRRIIALATDLGLDSTALQRCMEHPATQATLARHVSEAHALRVFGTPTFFINNQLFAGAQPIARWRDVLEGGDRR